MSAQAAVKLHGYTAADLRDCALREVNYRRRVFEKRIMAGSMTRVQADREIGRMTAIAEYFAELDERERLL